MPRLRVPDILDSRLEKGNDVSSSGEQKSERSQSALESNVQIQQGRVTVAVSNMGAGVTFSDLNAQFLLKNIF
jgi:hypothetical protein